MNYWQHEFSISARAADRESRAAVPWAIAGMLAFALALTPAWTASAGQSGLEDAFDRAVQLFQSGNYSEAEAQFKDIVKQAPQAPEPDFFLGRICLNTHRPQEAEDWLKKATALKPDFVDAWKALGQSEFELRKFQSAKEAQLKVIALEPGDFNAYFNLGVAFENLGDDESAMEAFAKASALAPSDSPMQSRARTNAGLLDLKIGKRELAAQKTAAGLKRLEAAQELLPPSSELYSALGDAYNQAKDPRAFEFLLKAGELNDAAKMSSNNRSRQANENPSGSVAALERRADAQPASALTQIELASALWDKFECHKALDHYQQVARLEPGSARAQYLVGYLEQTLGNSAAAKPFIEKALALDPNLTPAKYTMGELLASEGNWPEASRYLTAVANDPANGVSIRIALGQMFLDHANLDLARGQLESAEKMDPDNKKVHYLLGRYYAAAGRPELAAHEYELFSNLENAEMEKVRLR